MRVILSMTTIPARNGSLGPTLLSLASQTVKPDGMVIYLPPGAEDPRITGAGEFAALNMNVECIHSDFDLGPVMKLGAVIEDVPPDALVVTVDDDIIYESRWLETLVEIATFQLPNAAIGYSGWNIDTLIAGGTYRWPQYRPEKVDVLEGWAGAAYRARFFDAAVMKVPPEFKFVDDVWISSWLAKRGIERWVVQQPLCRWQTRPIDGSTGLHNRSDFVGLNREAAKIGFRR